MVAVMITIAVAVMVVVIFVFVAFVSSAAVFCGCGADNRLSHFSKTEHCGKAQNHRIKTINKNNYAMRGVRFKNIIEPYKTFSIKKNKVRYTDAC